MGDLDQEELIERVYIITFYELLCRVAKYPESQKTIIIDSFPVERLK